jgi:hypothetical protein
MALMAEQGQAIHGHDFRARLSNARQAWAASDVFEVCGCNFDAAGPRLDRGSWR